ncbi:MAG: VanZ family protein [Acidobacteriia bacterium]|nr:VanZ family protein [Terriglobia bacterium]
MPSRSDAVRRAWAPALLWLALIAWESTAFAGSENTGDFLYPIVKFLDPQITFAQFLIVHGLLRKAGHFIGYAVLSLLMLRAWWTTLMLPRWAKRLPSWRSMLRSWSARAAAIALASTVLVAALDEWHQTMLPGRTGAIRDVALDAMAAACVQLLLIAVSDARGKPSALSS